MEIRSITVNQDFWQVEGGLSDTLVIKVFTASGLDIFLMLIF